jgi:histone deacetylase 1/2
MASKTVKGAMADPKWLSAMQAEYKALMDNQTWSLVPLPSHRRAIGCKWIFRVEENPDGSVNKYKARLVAQGFSQTVGFDFTETFSQLLSLLQSELSSLLQSPSNGKFSKLMSTMPFLMVCCKKKCI